MQIIETPEGKFQILRPTPEREIEFIRNANRAMAKEALFDEVLSHLEDAARVIETALPYLPADTKAVYAGEWLGDIRAMISKAKESA